MARDITTLPKWAQSEIKRLLANADYYKKAALEQESGESNVFQRDYTNAPMGRRPILRDSTIIFVPDEGGSEFEASLRDEALEITMSGGSLRDRIAVRPISSNVIAIEGWEE